MKNEENKIDPEVKKAIWKIVIYAVSVLAALFGGNVAAKNGYHFIPNDYSQIEIKKNVKQCKSDELCIASAATKENSLMSENQLRLPMVLR